MRGFDSGQLAAFAAVVEQGSFDGAASVLHLTQPGVSQRIKALERRAGQVLVRRTRPVAPTPAGRVVLRLARQEQLASAEALRELGLDEQRFAPLRVAMNSDSLATWALRPLVEVARERRVALDVVRADEHATAALLRGGEAAAAVTAGRDAPAGCVAVRLGVMRYVPVASPGFARQWFHEDARAGLARAPVVDFDHGDPLQRAFARRVLGRDAQPPRCYVPSTREYLDAIGLGLGWGLVPEQQLGGIGSDGAPGLSVVVPGEHADVELSWQRWSMPSSTLDALTESVRGAGRAALRPLEASSPRP